MRNVIWAIPFLLMGVQVYSQCTQIRNIINSDLTRVGKSKELSLYLQKLKSTESDSLPDCYHDMGYQWYFKNWQKNNSESDIRNAIAFTLLAIESKKNAIKIDTISLRRSMYNVAHFFKVHGDIYKSINMYRNVVSLGINDKKWFNSKRDLGLILTDIGEFNEALGQFRDAVVFFKKDKNHWKLLSSSYIDIANCYATMDYLENRDSIEYYIKKGKNLLIDKGLTDSYENMQLKILEGTLLLGLKRYNAAIEVYNQVIKSDYEEKKIPEIILNNLGFCQLKVGDTASSRLNLLKAIEINPDFSYPYENLGDLYFEQKEFDKGLKYYQQAIQIVTNEKGFTENSVKLPDIESLELTQDKLTLLDHLTTKANAWLRYYEFDGNETHLANALATFKKADELIDTIKRENTEFKSKLYWRQRGSKLYTTAVETCLYLNDPEQALYFMERNKALLLLEDLTHEKAKQVSRLPDSIAQSDFEMKRTIALSENRFKNEALDVDAKDSLKESIFDLKREYRNFLKQISNEYPAYTAQKSRMPIVGPQELKTKYVDGHRAVVHYLMADSTAYGLLTTDRGSELFKVGDEQFLDQLTQTVRQINSHRQAGSAEDTDASEKVFHSLFPKDIYEKIRGKSLLIVPDGNLQQLPFGALPVPGDSGEVRESRDTGKYLIEEVDIQYAYSVSLLNQLNTFHYEHETALAAFAPVDFGTMGLTSLAFSDNEVSEIAKSLDGKIFDGGQATTDEFASQLQKSGIVHLATHADVGTDNTGWIAFADRKLYLEEIYALQSQADMVALSACKTSAGDVSKGEGVMSIARGLFNIGTKSVLSTLWAVDEVASKDLVVDYYKQLEKGLTKSQALQQAKLNYLERTEEPELKHPYYWAGFIVIGDNSPLSHKPVWPYLLLGIGLIVGVGLAVYGIRKIKARRVAA